MSNNNETKYMGALNKLKSKSSKNDLIQVKIKTCSLDMIEEIMSHMEWNLNTTVNSCVTHTISVSKSINLNEFNNFTLMDDFEDIEIDLSVKNENRLTELAESHELDFDNRFVSYALTESISSFYYVLFHRGLESE